MSSHIFVQPAEIVNKFVEVMGHLGFNILSELNNDHISDTNKQVYIKIKYWRVFVTN